jgi:hypothetical protein
MRAEDDETMTRLVHQQVAVRRVRIQPLFHVDV